MKLKLYKNLNNGLWSNKGKDLTTGKERVLFHSKSQLLSNVKFTVGELSRQRVIREKQRNVHAYAVGEKVENYSDDTINQQFKNRMIRVSYNPYLKDSFYRVDNGQSIFEAKYCYLSTDGHCYVIL